MVMKALLILYFSLFYFLHFSEVGTFVEDFDFVDATVGIGTDESDVNDGICVDDGFDVELVDIVVSFAIFICCDKGAVV